MTETIPIAADHAGFELKEKLKAELEKAGYQPLDLGTNSTESTDYPDYAHALAAAGGERRAEAGHPPVRHRTRHGGRGEPASPTSEPRWPGQPEVARLVSGP